MGYYEKNTEILFGRFPKLKEHINDVNANYTVASSEVEGKKVLFVQDGEKVTQLDSLYDMDSVLDLWIDSIEKDAVFAKYFFFGLGNGCIARKLLSVMGTKDKLYLFEPDFTILNHTLHEYDFTDLFEDERFELILISAVGSGLIGEFDKRLDYVDIKHFQYFCHPNYNSLFKPIYQSYMTEFENSCNSINSTQSVIGRFNVQYYANTFVNMNYLMKSKSLGNLYQRLPKTIPAVVVASGPSLDKNVADLKEAVGRAFIIASDSSIRTLLRAGIKPDLCVTIDAKKLPKHFSEEGSDTIPMVCQLTSNPVIMDMHHAEKFFINELNLHVQHFFSKHSVVFPVASTGGSVANTAMAIAQMMGFKKIIMIGQDLAYTDNRTHSAASVRGEWNIDATTLEQVMTEGIDGQPIAASGEFTLYRLWIEEQIRDRSDLEVVDATEGGALIHGSKIMTLRDAIKEYCGDKTYDFASIIHQTDDFMDAQLQKEFVEYVHRLPQDLEECMQKTKEGIRAYEQMLKMIYADKYHSQSFKSLYERTEEIGKFLDKAPAMEYVRNQIQNETTEFLKRVYDGQQDERKELMDSCDMGVEYLNITKRGIEAILSDVEEHIAVVRMENEDA